MLPAYLNHMHSRNSRKNVTVCRMGDKYAIFNNADVTVRTFCNDLSPMEYTFIASFFLCLGRCHTVYQQIQRFNITVKETGIFHFR